MFTIIGEPKIVTETREKILKAFEDLEFYEEGHKYLLHGQEISLSVSGVGHRFIREPFNEKLQAARYAQKHGKTAEHWIKQWKCNSFRATTLGTKKLTIILLLFIPRKKPYLSLWMNCRTLITLS